jgi:hypothetical protein
MKNNLIQKLALPFLVLMLATSWVQAKSTVVGDLILLGSVERSGQKLTSDTSVFEGDSIRTQKASGGVLTIARGRVEIGESSEVEVVRQNPLRIVVKSGTIAFNFPSGTALEIVTPQLEVHPNLSDGNLSGIVTASPQTEDRVQSRSGNFTILERKKNGAANHLMPGQILIATLLPVFPVVPVSSAMPEPPAAPQGPLGGPQIAIITAPIQGDVRVARAANTTNFARVAVPPQGLGLASGDFVRTLNGRANVSFTDQSVITLTEGTTVQIQERMQAGTLTRRISQYVGSLWFSITKAAGTQTTLETPTAVAAIRGTDGVQDVPNPNTSIHALNEGLEQITEVVTQQSVTLRSGQRVTAVRGVGFTPIVALLAAILQPSVIAGPGGAQGGAQGAAGAPRNDGSAASAATTVIVSALAAIGTAAISVGAATAVAVLAPTVARKTSQPASPSTPLNPPGGA